MSFTTPHCTRKTRKGARIAFREKVRQLTEVGKTHFFISGNGSVRLHFIEDEISGNFARLMIQHLIDEDRIKVIMVDVSRRSASKSVWIDSKKEDEERRIRASLLPGDEWKLGVQGTSLGERHVIWGEEKIDGIDETELMEVELAEYDRLLNALS